MARLRYIMAALAALLASGGAAGQEDAAAKADREAWEAALRADSHAAYLNYLRQFPTGRFSTEAFASVVRFARQRPGVPQPQFELRAAGGEAAQNPLLVSQLY